MTKKEKAEFNEYVKLINEEVEDVKDTSTGSAIIGFIVICLTLLNGILLINHLRDSAQESNSRCSLADGTYIDTDMADVVYVQLDEDYFDPNYIVDTYVEYEFEGVDYVEFNKESLVLTFTVGDEGKIIFNMDHVVAWGIDK